MNKKEMKQFIQEEIKSILENNIVLDPYLLADWVEEKVNLLDGEDIYNGQSIPMILNFLRNGRPSQVYIKSIIQNLVSLGFPITQYQFKKQEKLKPSSSAMVSGPTEPSKGYMGSSWTGD